MDTRTLIAEALQEDAAFNDLTAQATIDATQQGSAMIMAKADGTLSGCTVAAEVFRILEPATEQQWFRQDGDRVAKGDIICELTGPMRALLAAERTALNFMQLLSGIATATAAFVAAMVGSDCLVVDTRKTAPGLRHLEKEAVVHGGGANHRIDLASGMLIKENHIEACGSIGKAIAACRALNTDVRVECECETLEEVREAVEAQPDVILLDNMAPERVREARAMVPDTITLEASGNITLENAADYAATGVDRIAIGAITHSAPVLDLSMRVKRGL